ncbi:MAG: acyl-CoA dehydrogenase family protein [Mycobacterium sp.]|nr:acyl-CoA dehydrogenase family protein [Mycobacterium sp.]
MSVLTVPCVLSDELEMFRDSVRSFAQAKLADGYLERALRDEFPPDFVRQLATRGLIGLEVGAPYGGQAADYLAAGIAVEEVARADFNAAYLIFNSTVTGSLIERMSPLAAQVLPRLVSGDLKLCLALTEPGSGSDAAAMSTVAKAVPGGWRLRGEKTSVTGLPSADLAIVFARTGQGASAFLVDLDDPSVSRQRFRDPGLRPIGRGAVTFDDTFVPQARLLGQEGRGFQLVMHEFDYTRALLGLMAIAAAEHAIDMTVEYTQQRSTFGQPLCSYQGVTFPIAEHLTQLEAARWLCYRALSLRTLGRPHTREAAMVKWWAPQLAVRAIEDCIVLHGHVGWSDEMPLQSMRRDVSGLLIGDGTPQIQKLIIARETFGRAAVPRAPAPSARTNGRTP